MPGASPAKRGATVTVVTDPGTGWVHTPVLSTRAALDGGRDGPLVVEEYDATCVVPPGARASLDGFGNIVVEMDAGGT